MPDNQEGIDGGRGNARRARHETFFESFEYARERVAEEHERAMQQLEDDQPDPTFANRGSE